MYKKAWHVLSVNWSVGVHFIFKSLNNIKCKHKSWFNWNLLTFSMLLYQTIEVYKQSGMSHIATCSRYVHLCCTWELATADCARRWSKVQRGWHLGTVFPELHLQLLNHSCKQKALEVHDACQSPELCSSVNQNKCYLPAFSTFWTMKSLGDCKWVTMTEKESPTASVSGSGGWAQVLSSFPSDRLLKFSKDALIIAPAENQNTIIQFKHAVLT